jgi:hypothetical protein
MKNKLIKKDIKTKWLPVIEIHAQDLTLSWKRIAELTGICYDTLYYWTRQPEFKEACYKRYMELHGDKAIHVVEALYIEATQGNVRAMELYLKHTGKYTEKKVHEISPSEAFMQSVNRKEIAGAEIVDGEVLQDPMLEVHKKVHQATAPKVHEHTKVHRTVKEEEDSIERTKKTYKKYKVNREKRNALLRLKRRAKKVGLKSLGNGRPSKTERAKWVEELERLENEQGIKPPSR